MPKKRSQPRSPKTTGSSLDLRPVVVALGLGSNLGEQEATLRRAVRALSRHLSAPRLSSPYSTQALCDPDQPRFLNAVLVASCTLEPEQILGLAKAIEWLAGRRGGPRYGPRPLDVDLLVYGALSIDRPDLVVPHPRLRQRRFVLCPLAEIAPELPVPPDEATAASLLEALPNDQDIDKLTWSIPPI